MPACEENAMTRSSITSATLIGTLAMSGVAFGQPPPDTVPSDAVGNTAMGSSAMATNTSSYQNTAAGAHDMESNTTGNRNFAVGQGALRYNPDGTFNTGVGDGALYYNTTGIYNTGPLIARFTSEAARLEGAADATGEARGTLRGATHPGGTAGRAAPGDFARTSSGVMQ
jgi:hypothetical protein